MTLSEKIIHEHYLAGEKQKGKEVSIKIDQTLTQDSTGTMAYLQLEAMEIDQVKTKRSVAYIDHNMLQEGFENADDHKYIQTVTNKHGVYFSRPGNGICHQVHLERFGVPGQTLLGSDSHTPTCGGVGMLAIGAGGLDVAVCMGGGAFDFIYPKIINVKLSGKLNAGVTAKDVILEVLRQISVKGGVNKILEYTGEGVKSLTVPERATITNMGAEVGATTSIFPSDEVTKRFLEAQGRVDDYRELSADENAEYDETIEIDLSTLEASAACPHSPDNVKKISELDFAVDQVAIGSCTNSSYQDLMRVARILKGNTTAENVSLVISPGSKQVMTMLAENGALADILASGARILESGCGPCIGMGQSPATNAVSLRTFNRNFKGRCGTESADVYLVSPETAAVSALTGRITEPSEYIRKNNIDINIEQPQQFKINDNMVIPPSKNPDEVMVVRGPNIKPFPTNTPLPQKIEKTVLIKLEDNITTDHIMPSNAKLLPYRSNIPYLSEYCLSPCDAEFSKRAKQSNGGFIVAGDNYGQGSSREHAALVPLYLGIKAVIAKSFARIHRANLINSGILPLTFKNASDYNDICEGDTLIFDDCINQVKGKQTFTISTVLGKKIETVLNITDKELNMILAGGKINMLKNTEDKK